MSGRGALRPGEQRLTAPLAGDASVSFIGYIESPWSHEDCPKNPGAARARGGAGALHLRPELVPALDGLAPGMAVVLLYWMSDAPRDLLRQAPSHKPEGAGTFALRSPARPNPIGMGVVTITDLDSARGWIQVDAIDAVNGTPLIDIKPFIRGVDIPAQSSEVG